MPSTPAGGFVVDDSIGEDDHEAFIVALQEMARDALGNVGDPWAADAPDPIAGLVDKLAHMPLDGDFDNWTANVRALVTAFARTIVRR